MVTHPLEWLRKYFSANEQLFTQHVNKLKDGTPFHLSGGSAVRMWPSKDPTRPINANITLQIKGIRQGASIKIEPVNVRVQISAQIAMQILENLSRVRQVDPYFDEMSIEHFSLHCGLVLPRTSTDNTKLVLASLNRSELVPNLWFTKQDAGNTDTLIQGSEGSLSMTQVVAANRTLVYRGKKIENIPLKVQKGNVLFLGKQYPFEGFTETVLQQLSIKEMMTPSGTIAIPKMDERNELVYRRALHYLSAEMAKYNGIKYEVPIPSRTIFSPDDIIKAE